MVLSKSDSVSQSQRAAHRRESDVVEVEGAQIGSELTECKQPVVIKS